MGRGRVVKSEATPNQARARERKKQAKERWRDQVAMAASSLNTSVPELLTVLAEEADRCAHHVFYPRPYVSRFVEDLNPDRMTLAEDVAVLEAEGVLGARPMLLGRKRDVVELVAQSVRESHGLV